MKMLFSPCRLLAARGASTYGALLSAVLSAVSLALPAMADPIWAIYNPGQNISTGSGANGGASSQGGPFAVVNVGGQRYLFTDPYNTGVFTGQPIGFFNNDRLSSGAISASQLTVVPLIRAQPDTANFTPIGAGTVSPLDENRNWIFKAPPFDYWSPTKKRSGTRMALHVPRIGAGNEGSELAVRIENAESLAPIASSSELAIYRAQDDSKVTTPFGTILPHAGACFALMTQKDRVRVFNLTDRHMQVAMPGGKGVEMGPGTELLLSKQPISSPRENADGIGRRPLTTSIVAGDVNGYFTQFSLGSMLRRPELRALKTSANRADQKVFKTVYKMALITIHMYGADGYWSDQCLAHLSPSAAGKWYAHDGISTGAVLAVSDKRAPAANADVIELGVNNEGASSRDAAGKASHARAQRGCKVGLRAHAGVKSILTRLQNAHVQSKNSRVRHAIDESQAGDASKNKEAKPVEASKPKEAKKLAQVPNNKGLTEKKAKPEQRFIVMPQGPAGDPGSISTTVDGWRPQHLVH